MVGFNPNQSQTRKVECKCHPNSRSWQCWLAKCMCVWIWDVCTPFYPVVGSPVTVPSFDLGQVWHSDGWAPLTPGRTHRNTLKYLHTHISAPCFLPDLMLAKSNFELTYKYHLNIKPLHMALNPIHSIDKLTLQYPVGKYASFPPCTMTSSAMFVKTQ